MGNCNQPAVQSSPLVQNRARWATTVALLALAVSTPALAMSAEAPNKSDTAPPDPAIVVTGSRITRQGFSAPTPVTVAPVSQLEQTTPSSIPEALAKLPVFAGQSQAVTIPTRPGGAFLNMRNMGAQRSLILFDGHRLAPSSFDGTVDVNSIPQMLVQRVEVVTGGASAVYGSDAITGVVNFVLDKKFTGLKAVAQGGISDFGDARSYRLGLAGGTKFAEGRGHFVFSAERYENNGVAANEDRPWSSIYGTFTGAGTAANPYSYITDARLVQFTEGGLVRSGPFSGKQFVTNPDGTVGLTTYNAGTATNVPTLAIGGDGAVNRMSTLIPHSINTQGFARLSYELSPQMEIYAQANVSQATIEARGRNAYQQTLTIYSGNAFLPAAAQQQLTTGNVASFTLNRYMQDIRQDAVLDSGVRTITAQAGVTGKLGGFKYDISYTHADSRQRNLVTNALYYPNFYAAIDSVKDASGNAVCRVTTINPALFPNCVPYNPFGTNGSTAAQRAWFEKDISSYILSRLDNVGASLSGNPFATWAGPVSVAVSAEFRRQTLREYTDSNPAIGPMNLTNLRQVLSATPSLNYGPTLQTTQNASNQVWEVAGETIMPLLRDAPFAQLVELSLSGRYARYTTTGGAVAWKAGLSWQPIPDLRFRASQSRDIRAPTLIDLYAAQTISRTPLTDLHTGVNATYDNYSQGNPDLKPEVARTQALGVVLSPRAIPGFNLSFDYYIIKIDNAIASLTANTATMRECENSGGTSAVCALLVRPNAFSDTSAANAPLYVRTLSVNASQLRTHGFDVEASYGLRLSKLADKLPGKLDLRVLWSHQPLIQTQTLPSSPALNNAGTPGVSVDRLTAFINFSLERFSFNWQARYLSGQKRTNDPTLFVVAPKIDSIVFHDVNFEWKVDAGGHEMRFFTSVNNLFNTAPRTSPIVGNGTTVGLGSDVVSSDPLVGRYFTFGIRARY